MQLGYGSEAQTSGFPNWIEKLQKMSVARHYPWKPVNNDPFCNQIKHFVAMALHQSQAAWPLEV